jgi:hypothetical protein
VNHKAIQTALLSFLMNLFSDNISPSTFGIVLFFRMLWAMGVQCQCSLRCKLEMGAEHR